MKQHNQSIEAMMEDAKQAVEAFNDWNDAQATTGGSGTLLSSVAFGLSDLAGCWSRSTMQTRDVVLRGAGLRQQPDRVG